MKQHEQLLQILVKRVLTPEQVKRGKHLTLLVVHVTWWNYKTNQTLV
jgi:hypothetical protein